MSSPLKYIDLFAGIGGFRIALQQFNTACVFSSEWDKYAALMYKENFGETPAGDITKIEPKDIPAHDLICGGFPCQPFSVSGKQKGFEDTRGTLFFDIARIADYHKPKMLFLENVANLNNHSDGETIATMKRVLEDLGYDVNLQVLNASDYGVPQSRKRLYFVCFRKDLNVSGFSFPAPLNTDIVLQDILLPSKETKKYVIDRTDIKIDKLNITGRHRKPVRVGTINKGGQGDRIYSTLGHAITLSAQGGGSGAKTGAYLVDGKVRKLAPEECRRVQGFPEGFKLVGSDAQLWKQFGNSVAVPVLVEILKEVRSASSIL